MERENEQNILIQTTYDKIIEAIEMECEEIRIRNGWKETIFTILQKMNRKAKTADLHSFEANIKSGVVFVECRGYEVFIKSFVYDDKGEETRTEWTGTTIAAANRLEMLGIDFDSIEV